ncbi:MAG: aromatic amino acid hydroxylase [Leeuwenhoekiella sp.]
MDTPDKQNIPTNPLLDKLPPHLRQYIKPQNYAQYTAINQAVWRYVMRKNVAYLKKVAHGSYLEGLEKTGISTDAIPSMYGMNRILQDIGWAAVAVDGFIPPGAFMEFQAYNVLVIASDIRQLENMEYTPAPDIIHEGAGHAPIIANPEYAEYLRRFGEIGCKAIASAKDHAIYEAVRKLSILKESPNADKEEIEKTEAEVHRLQADDEAPSEMATIRNLHWWTVEYGLIGTLENPRIYGAGLLSSIGESKWCMTDEVKKLPYSIAAADQEFDITQPQPQLFVTPDFAYLSQVLEEFANTMALRRGGPEGLQKLIDSKNLGTVELSTGLQISGVFTKQVLEKDRVAYLQTTGPTALSYRNKELVGHGTNTHAKGYGSALGKLKGINLAIEDMSPRDLKAYKIYEGEEVLLEFEGGVTINGKIITGTRNLQGKIIMISFENCTVRQKGTVLFEPEWGRYDMAVGKRIASAFAGPADFNSFDLVDHETSASEAPKMTEAELKLDELYLAVRQYREGKTTKISLEDILTTLKTEYSQDWLLTLEIYELSLVKQWEGLVQATAKRLDELQLTLPKKAHLITDGIALISKKPVAVN